MTKAEKVIGIIILCLSTALIISFASCIAQVEKSGGIKAACISVGKDLNEIKQGIEEN